MNEKNGFEYLPLSAEASDSLRYKVEALSATPIKPASKLRWIPAMALSGVAVATVFALLLSAPSQSVAAKLMAVRNAVEELTSMHLWVTSRDSGGEQVEVAFTDQGEFMVNAQDAKVYVLKDGIHIYEPKENTVFTMPISINLEGVMANMKENFMPSFSVDGLLKQMEAEVGAENVKVSKTYKLEGRVVFDVLLTPDSKGDSSSRATMTVDQATDLPIKVIEERLENGAWVQNTLVNIRYNDDVSALLKPSFPKDAKRQEGIPGLGNMGEEIQREISRELQRHGAGGQARIQLN